MSADPERIRSIVDELIRQRRRLGSAGPLLEANGRAIAYWQSQRATAPRKGTREPGYTEHRSRM